MTRSRMRAMSAALVVAAALVLTGCSSDSDDATSDESSPAQTETAAHEVDPNAPRDQGSQELAVERDCRLT